MLWKGCDFVSIMFIPQPLGHWPVSHKNRVLNEVAHLLTGGQTPPRPHSLASVTTPPQAGKPLVVTETAGPREQRLICVRLVVPAGARPAQTASGETMG